MAQEVCAEISQKFRAIADNVDLLPNVVGAGALNQLQNEMQAGFAELLAVGQQSIVLGMQNSAAIQQLRADIRISNHNTQSRLLNALRDGNEPLEWLQNQDGLIPDHAPFAEADVHRSSLEGTNALLAHYGLQLAGNQHEAAERLLQFIGRRRL